MSEEKRMTEIEYPGVNPPPIDNSPKSNDAHVWHIFMLFVGYVIVIIMI